MTGIVANMVVTIPVTVVSGFPSFITSTVFGIKGAPVFSMIFPITADAVSPGPEAGVWHWRFVRKAARAASVRKCFSCFIWVVCLVAGCWLLVAGCWLLVAGCWLLVAGQPGTG